MPLLVVSAAAPLAAQQPASPALVEVQISGGPRQVLDAVAHDSTLLLSLDAVVRLAEIRADSAGPGQDWQGRVDPAGTPIAVSTAGRLVRRGSRNWMLAPEDALWSDGRLYVRGWVLERLLDVGVEINWADLVVVLRRTDALPVVRRMEREARQGRLLAQRTASLSTVALDQPTPVADGAVLDWDVTTALSDPFHGSGVDLGLGAGLGGGGLRLVHAERSTTAGRYAATRWAWMRAWSGSPALRQVRLGYIGATGPTPLGILGLALTNAPYLRSSEFGPMDLRGMAPAGWDVEVYRDQDLIAAEPTDRSGGYVIPLPAHYGNNLIAVTAYGPHGEERQYRRALLVTEDRLPAGKLEYGVSAGACSDLPCWGLVNADVRYGALQALTLQGGATYVSRDSVPGGWHPYLDVTAAPHPSLSVAVQAAAGAFASGQLWFVPTPDLNASLDHITFTGRTPDPVLGWGTLRTRTTAELFWRPAHRDRAVFWRARALVQATTGLQQREAGLTATVPLPRGRLALGAGYRTFRLLGGATHRSAGTDAAFALLLPRSAGRWHDVLVRSEVAGAADSGLTRASLSWSRQISPSFRLEAGGIWRRTTGLRLELGLSTSLSGLRAVQTTTYDRAAGIDGLQVLEGSVLWDPASGQVSLADGRSLDRGGVTGLVYRDENANGRRDPGEALVAGAQVRIGPQVARTDANGRFSAWDLVPFDPAVVEIDSLSLDSPLWMPAATRFTIVPTPNAYRHVELPLVLVGEISGTVLRDGHPAAGVPVRFESQDGVRLSTTTFADGGFYVFGVRPGRYRVVAADQGDTAITAEFDPARDPRGVTGVQIVLPKR